MSDIPDLPPVLERLLEGGEHDAVGAYALDALPSAERQVFEMHLAGCGQCQTELVLLRQSAAILRRALVPEESAAEVRPTTSPPPTAVEPPPPVNAVDEAEAPPIPQSPAPEAEPATFDPPPIDTQTLEELEAPGAVVSEADITTDDEAALPQTTAAAEPVSEPATEPAPQPVAEGTVATVPRNTRPRGRIAPGMPPSADAAMIAAPARSSKLPWIVAALGLAFGIGAVLAALALAEMKGNLEDEIDFQNAQIAELNAERDTYLEQTSAIAWNLAPTTLGAPGSTAVVYADPSGASAILSVTGMNPLGSDQVYQVWYLPAGGGEPEPGPVFTVDSNGGAVVQITPDLSAYEALAVTTEPSGGSEAATTDPVIQGFISVQ